jgi:DNA adenine methylase
MEWTLGADKALVPIEASTPLRPLLKRAGGKRQLLPALRRHFPASFDRYIEPFVGSGAVFFDLYSSGRLKGRRARLVDLNPDLIGCYRAVRDQTETVIAALHELEQEHRERGSECYYEVRDGRFNPARAGRVSACETHGVTSDSTDLAAMFIYLNRTGFNGLFRLNRNGGFNVPAGRYAEPRICDAERVRLVAQALSSDGVTLECIPFEETLADAGRGDFVYCDPPYAPLSRTASFAHYTAGGFGVQDHHRLQQSVVTAAKRGAVVVMSHSSAPSIVAAYSDPAATRAGLTMHRVPARRAINSRAVLRGPVDELIITNAAARARRPARITSALHSR